MTDLLQEFIVDFTINSGAVVERQACVQRKSLEICNWIDVDGTVLRILKDFFDGNVTFEVKNWHVGLHSWAVQSSGSSLATVFA